MEKNLKIMNVKTVNRDGEIYVQYSIFNNGEIKDFERPMYDKNGNVDPEVANLLELAKKQEYEGTEETVEKVEEVTPEQKKLVVYKEKGFFAKNWKFITTGLAGVALGAAIVLLAKGCETEVPTTDNTLIEDQIDDQMTITYMTEEEYAQGVKDLRKYLNDTLGYKYQSTDLTAFYYICNMENVSGDLFETLVTEGYLANNENQVMQDAFNVASDLINKSLENYLAGNITNIDYSKMFVNKHVVNVFTDGQGQFNSMIGVDTKAMEEIMTKQNNYVFGLETIDGKTINAMPVGALDMYHLLVSTPIDIAGGLGDYTSEVPVGVSVGGEARQSIISDNTKLCNALNQEFINLSIGEADKQLTK